MPRRYTDTTLSLLVKNRDLSNASHVYVTICQYIPEDVSNTTSGFNMGINSKKETTIEATSVSYSNPNTVIVINLTQEQNALFEEGFVLLQVNWIYSNNKRKATIVK